MVFFWLEKKERKKTGKPPAEVIYFLDFISGLKKREKENREATSSGLGMPKEHF